MENNNKKQDSDFASKLSDSGELERKERIKAIIDLKAHEVTAGEAKNKKEMEDVIRSFGLILNENDNRLAEIPLNTIGKIYSHKGYNLAKIIDSIPFLYKTAIHGWSEQEIFREGHKHHPNIKAYHHYINKFRHKNNEYYIRFTIYELKVKHGRVGRNYIHSTAISNVDKYRKDDVSHWHRVIYPGKLNTSSFYDYRLAEFLNSVKLYSQLSS